MFMQLRKLNRVLAAAVLAALCGCSSDSAPSSDAGADGQPPVVDSTGGGDGPPVADGMAADQGQSTLPPAPQQAGVVYVANYDSPKLFFYRTDGTSPLAAGSIDLDGETHNMALDPINDLLFVVSHQVKSVTVYRLSRPAAPDQPLTPPAKLATISPGMLPMFARVDPQHHRLYVVAALDNGEAEEQFQLLAYDTSDPASPVAVAGSPFLIPATSALALDPARRLLFVEALLTDKLHAFDLHGDQLVQLPGDPLDLRALYPQEHQVGFVVHAMSVDIRRNRLYATRSQSVLSELIVIDYPAALPTASQGYAQLASHADFKAVPDPFDVDVDIEQRKTIYDAYLAAVDPRTGHLFLTAGGWEAMYVYGTVVAITSDLALGTGCSDYEGFGCWLQSYSNSSPTKKLRTGGALCVDHTHRVLVVTGYDADKNTELRGLVNMFSYDDSLALTPLLPADGNDLEAGSRPITAVCH